MHRRSVLKAAAVPVLAASLPQAGAQAAYPSKPITVVVSYPPGGDTDAIARLFADKLSTRLKQPVIVENKPGAGGSVGAGYVARAKPDGYTLLLANVGHAAAGVLYKNLPYDFERDMTQITTVANVPNVLVVAKNLPVNNVRELLAYAKAHPNDINYGSAGIGTTQHLSAELLKKQTGLPALHVPFKGAAPMMTDLIGGRITFALDSAASAAAQINGGGVKPLAVTSLARTRFLPDVPTLAESGVPGYEANVWFGIIAPAGTPPQTIAFLHKEISRVLQEPGVRQRLTELGLTPLDESPVQFQQLIDTEKTKWTKVIQEANIKFD